MRTTRGASIEDLRLAIECLPERTKIAMLEGIRANPIIVGAYSTREGICPMLAAHRAGGRTGLIAFARAWDRFALGERRRAAVRRATARELLILETHLEASLLESAGAAGELSEAIAEHRALVASHAPEPKRERPGDTNRAGDADRAGELRARPGWAWTRLFRRVDDYERAIERLGEEERALRRDRSPAPH